MKFNKNFESWHTECLIILVCKKNRKRSCGQLEKNWPNALGKTHKPSRSRQEKKWPNTLRESKNGPNTLRKTLAHCGLKIKIKQNRF